MLILVKSCKRPKKMLGIDMLYNGYKTFGTGHLVQLQVKKKLLWNIVFVLIFRNILEVQIKSPMLQLYSEWV